jgi:glyoxylase-like metal-dependent hydrolase (beta-lactamase superfamily II)
VREYTAGSYASRDIGHNIVQVDTGYQRPGLAACYVVHDAGQAAIIDTGVAHSVPIIEQALAGVGLGFADVLYIVPTHVHLDHAGGAGKLMQVCPAGRMIVHPRGARHMIDPSRLVAGAEAVYGAEELQQSVGEIVAVEADRVTEAADGFRFRVGRRELEVIDTPGHARHHFCLWDCHSRGIFTGDTFGVAYPELTCEGQPLLFPPTTPVQFDPDAWHASIDRLLGLQPEVVYLTHFGALQEPARHARDLHRSIDELAALALGNEGGEALTSAVWDYLTARLAGAGCEHGQDELHELLDMDIDLVVQGLEVWKSRLAENPLASQA